jgi:hypothetical protein
LAQVNLRLGRLGGADVMGMRRAVGRTRFIVGIAVAVPLL